MERVNDVTIRAQELLDDYEISQARREIDNLFWKDFCDYYIEIVKERLYQPEKHGKENQISGQIALYHSLLGILKLYAIYTPFVTEYIYQAFFKGKENEISIHQTHWQSEKPTKIYLEFGEHIKAQIADIRKYKTENQMSMKDHIPEMIIKTPEKLALRKILCKKKSNQTLPVKRADREILLLIALFPEWERGMRASA